MHTILFITPFSFAVSGADQSLKTLLAGISPKYNTLVSCPNSSPHKADFIKLGASLAPFPLMRLKRSANPLYWLAFLLWQPCEILFFVCLLLWKKVDLVHINMESSLSAAIACKIIRPIKHIACIIHYRGKTVDQPKWFFDRFLPLLDHLADTIIGISKASSAGFCKRNLDKKLEVVWNAVKNTSPHASTWLNDYPNTSHAIGLVARMDPQKRLKDAALAFDQIAETFPQARLFFIGGDNNNADEVAYQKELSTLCASQKSADRIHFLGHQSQVVNFMQDFDLLLMPAINEGFGRVVAEALSLGVRVIAADSGALPEVLETFPKSRLVPAKSPDALAKTSIELLQNPLNETQREHMRLQAQQLFGLNTHIARIEAIYQAQLKP